MRPAAVLDVVDELYQRPQRRRVDARLAAELGDRADLRIDRGPTLVHREVAIDAGMSLGRRAIEPDPPGNRRPRRLFRRSRRVSVVRYFETDGRLT